MAAKTKAKTNVQKLIIPETVHPFAVKFEPKTVIEKLANAKDQKATAFELLGDLSGLKVMANKVLVCMYIEPDMRGSIFVAKETLREPP